MKDSLRRRRRIIHVPAYYLLALLSRGLAHGDFFQIPDPIGLPETADAVGVWFDYSYDCFAMVVQDECFEEAPEGESFPVMKVKWSTVELVAMPKNAEALISLAEKIKAMKTKGIMR